MSSIAEKLALAKQAAVAASGIQGAVAAASAPAKHEGAPNVATTPRTASKNSVSALRPEDLIPKRTKESQVLFKTGKPSLNCVISGMGREPKRIHFLNQYLLTEDTEVIAYVRKNKQAFAISEVSATPTTEQK